MSIKNTKLVDHIHHNSNQKREEIREAWVRHQVVADANQPPGGWGDRKGGATSSTTVHIVGVGRGVAVVISS